MTEYEKEINNASNTFDLQFAVLIKNTKKTDDGKLLEKWFDLPMNQTQLKKNLEQLSINESYTIYDYEDYPFCDLKEFESLDHLNSLAKKLSLLPEERKTALIYYVDAINIYKVDEIIKVAAIADSIPFHFYPRAEQNTANEKKYGIAKAVESGLYKKLSTMKIQNYFDFEAYGKEDIISHQVIIFDEGYIDMRAYVDIKYDINEAINLINKEFELKDTLPMSSHDALKQISIQIEKCCVACVNFEKFVYTPASNKCRFIFYDQHIDAKLTDVIDRKNNFKDFFLLRENETSEACINRSISQLESLYYQSKEEQDITEIADKVISVFPEEMEPVKI